MRILMAHWTLRPGGAQVIMCRLTAYLRSKGHEVDFLTTIEPGVSASEMGAICDRHWHCAKLPYESQRAYLPRLAKAIDAGRYDLLMTHHSPEAVAAAGLLKNRTVAISVIHDDPIRGYGYVGLANPDAFHAFVGVSQFVTDSVRMRIGRPERAVCILNGIPEAVLPNRGPSPTIRCLFVGRLEEAQKGCLLLPKIVDEARRVRVPIQLTVAGDGPDRSRLQRAIDDCGVADCVTLLGSLPQADVQARMAHSDILISCSRHEGLSLAVLEAMAKGCVPVAHALPPLREIITDGRDGVLIEGRAPIAYAEALKRFHETPHDLERMRREAHATVIDRFGEERMCEEYHALILRSCASAPSRAGLCSS
jgi:glycosyltransferase involved in cell wall biosynthesis